MNHTEKELAILEKIHKSKDSIKQRDLAKIAGLSLGMTNAILKRLIEKGLITVKKVNNRNIRYAVSPSGIEVISAKSYRFFKKTIKNVVIYKEAIEELISDIKETGYGKITLVGKSDLDFIIEHVCMKKEIVFTKAASVEVNKDCFFIFSEYVEPVDENSSSMESSENRRYLKKILMG